MALFKVFADNVLVGHSELERGDPPMGVAFGSFSPEPAYSRIQSECVANHSDQAHLKLSVRTATGVDIPCIGVSVLDYSAEFDPPEIEVNVIGVECQLYGELFPEHVAAYENQFKIAQANGT